jgi:glutamine synthetase
VDSKTKKRIVEACKRDKVKFIQLWFTDILGQLKALTIPVEKLPSALDEGESFDGSSVEGFARIYESDLVVLPDPSTFQVLPWTCESTCVARMICDVVDPDLKPYDGDPRSILKRSIRMLGRKGFTPYLGPEIEYFYFADSGSPEALDAGGYFDLTPVDVNMELREKTVLTLEAMGIPVHASHHEVATSQHELDLKYDHALKIADAVMTARMVIKEVAHQHNVYATFMPKPIGNQNGSGMHVHQSLFKKRRNAFFNRRDKHGLSKTAKMYISGLLRYAPEMTAITNQWVNSYKRLVPGFEAPAYICWGSRNRSALVRVPLDKPDQEAPRRIEFRCADPACNPYLAFAVMLWAGLRGIEEGRELPDPVELDVYRMSPEERKKRGIATLPDSLFEAVEKTAQSDLVRQALGDALLKKFIENKRIEWDNYRTQVTQYELAKYLPIL